MVTMRSHTRTRPLLTAGAILGTLVVAPLASPVADAGLGEWNAGVKFLDFVGQLDVCDEEPFVPCTSGAGNGRSNTLRVYQSDDSGSLQYDALGSTSALDDHLWVGAAIGGTCRRGFSAFIAEINIDGSNDSSLFNEVEEVDGWAGQRFPVPDARVMTREQVAVNIPMEHAIGPDRRETIFAVGEAAIADRIDGGMTEEEARSLPFETVIPLDLTGEFVCRGNVGAHVKWMRAATVVVPIAVEYVGVPIETVGSELDVPGGGLYSAPEVTDAALAVVPDRSDDCKLHLSGVIHTSQPTTVDYHFVDPFGRESNTYSVDVDETLSAFVSRWVTVPALSEDDPSGNLTTEPGEGSLGGFLGEVDDSMYTGTFMIETSSPNHQSAADGFSVDYCDHVEVATREIADRAMVDWANSPTSRE